MNNGSGRMVRVIAHPNDADWLLLKARGDDIHTAFGSFGPAQRTDDGYVLHRDNMPALKTWARFHDVLVLNEVREQGERTRPVECGNVVAWLTPTGGDATEHDPSAVPVICRAPYPFGNLPRFCGACGQPASPVIFEDVEPVTGVRCDGCDRVVRGGAKFCPRCGAVLPAWNGERRQPVIPDAPRERLEDPVPIGAMVDGVTQ